MFNDPRVQMLKVVKQVKVQTFFFERPLQNRYLYWLICENVCASSSDLRYYEVQLF